MTERREKAAPRAEASEVYLGRNAIGKIEIRRKGEVLAIGANGRRIGIFKTDAEAMAEILRAAREAR
jgi:hypothetical protein